MNRALIVQFVRCKFRAFTPNSGVPQGCKLGPLPFLNQNDDKVVVIDSPMLLFTDDMKKFLYIKNQQDIENLHKQIHYIVA